MTENPLAAPRTSGLDVAHATVKAALSAIPVAGGAAVELFQLLVQPPLERRRERWMNAVADKLRELEAEGLDLSTLPSNEQFVTVVMHATQVAIRSHQNEKLEALRNAVANVAIGQAPDETRQQMFLDLVDSMTELHLRVLKAFQRPEPPPGMSMGGLNSVLEHNIPSLRGQQDLYRQVWRDLYSRGLVNTEGMNVTMSGSGLAAKRTTELGDQFLSFICAPATRSDSGTHDEAPAIT